MRGLSKGSRFSALFSYSTCFLGGVVTAGLSSSQVKFVVAKAFHVSPSGMLCALGTLEAPLSPLFSCDPATRRRVSPSTRLLEIKISMKNYGTLRVSDTLRNVTATAPRWPSESIREFSRSQAVRDTEINN